MFKYLKNYFLNLSGNREVPRTWYANNLLSKPEFIWSANSQVFIAIFPPRDCFASLRSLCSFTIHCSVPLRFVVWIHLPFVSAAPRTPRTPSALVCVSAPVCVCVWVCVCRSGCVFSNPVCQCICEPWACACVRFCTHSNYLLALKAKRL